MAAPFLQFPSISLTVLVLLLLGPLLLSPAYSLKCTSQTFTGNTHYSNCTDLPSLNSYLHWFYDPSNSTLSVAFTAPPAKSDGWIAWALNPTGTGMAGAQALLAYKASNGSMVVKTYNISSYSSIVESKLSFDVLDKKADFSKGVMRIFATLALPERKTTVNHIWQVGSTVNDGVPGKHEFKTENLNAKGSLELVKVQSQSNIASAPSPSPSASASVPSAGGNKAGPGSGATRNNGWLLGFHGFLLFVGILVYGF